MSRTVIATDTYQQPSWSSHAKYGARITWSDGSTTSCGHSHKTNALAERCLSNWLREISAADSEPQQ